MKLDPVLSKAARLAKSKNYENALKVLNAEEDKYYGSFKYYYLYAVICLYSGAFADAYTFFNHARKIKMKDPLVMLGLAVLFIRRLDTVQAVDYYLDVQELDPSNKIAKRALSVIRNHSNPELLSDWITNEKLTKLFPPIPFGGVDIKKMARVSIVVIAAVAITFAVLLRSRVIQNPFKDTSRLNTEFILTGQDKNAPVETGGSYRYILTRAEAVNLYDKALFLFTSFKDEEAKISLNRILESNAAEGIKNKARLLFNYMEIPGFDNFNRNNIPSYAEIRNEPFIYRDVYVIWKGMATNMEVTDEYTRFDFLVGYDTRKTLEGIITVVFNEPVEINPERPLEVLGKIAVTNTGGTIDIKLEGTAIHQSGRLEN